MSLADLMNVCVEGSYEDVKNYFQAEEQSLIENSKEIRERDSLCKTVVDKMAMLGRRDVLKYLIQNGFSIDEKSEQGYTPLHHAACWGHVGCLKELYFSGADLHAVNANGETARACALRYNQQAAIDFLDKAAAQVDLKSTAKNFKDIIADPERNLGRFNKEDRITGNRACDEKIDWVDTYKETASLTQIQHMKSELEEFMKPIMTKLEDNQAEAVKGNRSLSKAGPSK